MNRRIITGNKLKCSGCGVCAAVCPKQCIQMGKDELGFSIPIVNESSCISCGCCQKVCPQQNKRVFLPTSSSCFYSQSKHQEELSQSSSGGFFSILARWIIEKGGKVWGVAIDSEGSTEFICVDCLTELWRLRGSKYIEVKSPLNYTLVKSQLDNNELVMVSGLPCQILALHNYLGNYDYPNLLLVDLLCYGIQSPKMWKLYLNEVNPHKKPIKRIFMREKHYSWYDYSMKIEYQDNSSFLKVRWFDDWLLSYSRTVFNRESCTCCESKKFPRVSDFTIGDFWNIDTLERINVHINKKRGVSLVYAHSSLAIQIVKDVENEHIFENIDSILSMQMQKGHSSSIPFNSFRQEFINTAIDRNFKAARRLYLEGGLLFRLKKRKPIYIYRIKKALKKLLFI